MVVSRADESVILDPHPVPERAKFRRDFIDELLRTFPGGVRRSFDLLSVFVGSRQKKSIHPHHALLARDSVARDGRVGMADVRPCIHVVDGSGDVELWAW